MGKVLKIILLILGILVLIAILITLSNNQQKEQLLKLLNFQSSNQPTQAPETLEPEATSVPGENAPKDPQNTTYTIEGKTVTLVNGEAIDGNATTTLLGEPTTGDLNGDGANDSGVILVVSGTGSGTFYYAAAALNNTTEFAYEGTNALLLGDSVEIQSKSIENMSYTVNYAERGPDDAMTDDPTVNVTKNFTVTGSTLTESD